MSNRISYGDYETILAKDPAKRTFITFSRPTKKFSA
jgi:hypothetical protein